MRFSEGSENITVMFPLRVYFKALEMRFINTYLILISSLFNVNVSVSEKKLREIYFALESSENRSNIS